MEKITVSAFRWVPPLAQGLVRDFRVRWALEEAGLPYEQRLITLGEDQKSDAPYRKQQPFGQVPTLEMDGFSMFESGAIVETIAEKSEALMPAEHRVEVRQWIFAALNTIEPPITMLIVMDFQKDPGTDKLRAWVTDWIKKRLGELETVLGDREYLVGDRFTAADLMMSAVLRVPRTTDLVTSRPKLAAYVRRCCEDRPAFKKAIAAQMKNFEENAPPTQPS